jgi:hypothetical protein
MAEVQQDAQIVQSDLLDAQQRASRIRKDDLVTRLPRFVLDHELDLGVSPDQFAQPIDRELPDVVVVDLEWIVPTVLAEPELDVVAVQFLCQFSGFIEELQRLGSDRRVRVGDRSLHVVAVVDLRSDGDGAEPVALQGRADIVQRPLESGKRPVQIDDGQVTDRASLVDLLQQPDRGAVALRGVAVLVGGKVPDTRAENRHLTHIADSNLSAA